MIFEELKLISPLLKGLAKQEFVSPTEVQKKLFHLLFLEKIL